MTTNQLNWQSLLPDPAPLKELYASAAKLAPLSISDMQPRLESAVSLFCQSPSSSRFMLLKTREGHDYLTWLAPLVENRLPIASQVYGMRYQIGADNQVTCSPASCASDNFAAKTRCLYADWLESEQLFGCLRNDQQRYQLSSGLVHQANGGVLLLTLRALLSQPQLWLRLKQMVISRQFKWLAIDESRPLPLTIPDMPLDLRIILLGNSEELVELQEFEPELTARAAYAEFESLLPLKESDDITRWYRYVRYLAQRQHLPELDADISAPLVRQAIRYSGDQYILPLCPLWISDRLVEAATYASDKLDAQALDQAQQQKEWQQSYLPEKIRYDIESGQIHVATEGEVIGQVNGLSVLEYPGHPQLIGEPSRITCVAHVGDGEISDVERKVELGGSIHAKGMMIMEAFLIAELELEHQFPFAASIVFEQSYGEVDGDSASLAELCALISALSLQPLAQHIAVTGSVDQFGNVQPIGGVNEKIEGFFTLCQYRGLTGKQGVILPAANIHHLCLHDSVVAAVREGSFHLWAVDSIADTLPILTGLPYSSDDTLDLLSIIQGRVAQASALDKRRLPWCLRWLTWFQSVTRQSTF